MSHQTGIRACDDLRDFFAVSKKGDIRLIKVAIQNEQLVLDGTAPPRGTWEQDWDSTILPMLEEAQPCYIMYRLDKQTDTGYEWVFISYSPDHSAVRQKMLYAATRSTLKMEFGGGQVKDEVFGTIPQDISLNGFKRHITAKNAPAPLTFAEEELEMIKKNEVNADISVDTKRQTLSGIAFPISQDALTKLNQMRDGAVNYVQLSVDTKKETINLESSPDTDENTLRSRIPSDHPRYHFFNYKHTHEGDYLESIVFLYSMPGYKCSVKERMLYSSCKAPLLETVEEQLGIQIARKVEIENGGDVSPAFLYDEVHPKKTIVRPQFARPKGPAGRGPKRLTKLQDDRD